LIIATNKNDVLHRLMSKNQYEVHPLMHTITPSMDIAVSSNFVFEGQVSNQSRHTLLA
jgi:threonine synthase